MLALIAAAVLIGGLSLVPRPVSWRRFEVAVAVVGILAMFGLGSWLLALAFSSVGTVADRLATHGVPAPLLLSLPAILVVLLVWLGRLRSPNPQLSPSAAADRYVDDKAWYSSSWEREKDNPGHDLGTAGYRLELVDGPLAGRTARLRDSRFRLWVATRADDDELIVRGAIERPALQGLSLLGCYGFSHGDEAMVWTPEV